MNRDKYILYFDDTGNRKTRSSSLLEADQHQSMDWFALGGILIKEEDVTLLLNRYDVFCSKWGIDYPLQSSKIRGSRGKFGWLGIQKNKDAFLPELQEFLLSLPIVAIACIIDRPGYSNRYKDIYHNNLWPMAKTVLSILVERAAKFADASGRSLEIFFEQSGKKEDNGVVRYVRELKQFGNPFEETVSAGYFPLNADDYRHIVRGDPHRLSKSSPQMQIADLILYPLARGGYDPAYLPYRKLKEAEKLIDGLMTEEEVAIRGIKYSCFDDKK